MINTRCVSYVGSLQNFMSVGGYLLFSLLALSDEPIYSLSTKSSRKMSETWYQYSVTYTSILSVLSNEILANNKRDVWSIVDRKRSRPRTIRSLSSNDRDKSWKSQSWGASELCEIMTGPSKAFTVGSPLRGISNCRYPARVSLVWFAPTKLLSVLQAIDFGIARLSFVRSGENARKFAWGYGRNGRLSRPRWFFFFFFGPQRHWSAGVAETSGAPT